MNIMVSAGGGGKRGKGVVKPLAPTGADRCSLAALGEQQLLPFIPVHPPGPIHPTHNPQPSQTTLEPTDEDLQGAPRILPSHTCRRLGTEIWI